MKKDLVPQNEQAPVTAVNSPADIMQLAMNKDLDLDRIEKMLELQTKYEEREAKKAYTQAMANFKANPPEISKDKNVQYQTSKGQTNYSHATLGNVTQKINQALAGHDLSAGWKTEQDKDNITITCTITHALGHSESTSLSAGADTSGGKNSIQAVGSTITYLERYTLLALTGLATHDQDDDGRGSEGEGLVYITDNQKSTIVDMIADTSANEARFLKYLGAESIDTIPATFYNRAIKALEVKKEQA